VLVGAAGAGFYGLSQTARLDTAQFGLDILAALESMENGSTLIPARDACTLLSKHEVEDAIGIPVSQVRSVKNDASHTRCLYLPEGSRMKAVDLKVDWTGGVDAMSLVQSVTPEMIPDAGSVSGLGDASFYGPMDSTVYVLKGDTFVSLIFGVDQIAQEKQILLAEKAVSKL
jgi:hypothetical protein